MRSLKVFILFIFFSSNAYAAECWVAGNFVGKSAQSDQEYRYSDDRFADGMIICFDEDSGSVTGNDLPLIKLGASTLIGVSENGIGLEVVNTYQIDRAKEKVLITQSRIGTATRIAVLPDYVASYVGDARRIR